MNDRKFEYGHDSIMNESDNKGLINNRNLKIEISEYPKCDCGGTLVPTFTQ